MLAVLRYPSHRDVPSLRALADPGTHRMEPPAQAIATQLGSLDASTDLGQRLNRRAWALAAGLELDGEPAGRRQARGADQLWKVA